MCEKIKAEGALLIAKIEKEKEKKNVCGQAKCALNRIIFTRQMS